MKGGSSTMIIYSNKIYMEDGIKDGYLEIKDGKFVKFHDKSSNLEADKDYSDYTIIPGVFDTHNHGCFGFSMLATDRVPTIEEVKGYLKGLASAGVTSVFPTSTNVGTIRLLADNASTLLDGAKIVGIHSEGPWGARVGEKGVNTGYPKVDMAVAKEMVDAGQGLLKLVDIAPEVDGAIEAIKYFVNEGIFVGAYHTNANFKQANKGIDAGITVATHLGNVMTGLHHRDIGTLGACILRPEVDCEIICDGMHVDLEMIKLYFMLKDKSKFMMISDNVHYAGLPVGTYSGMTKDVTSDRKTIFINEEGFVLSETGRLSGSSKSVVYGMKNLVEKVGLPLEEVILMASLNPAKKYGFDKTKGSIVEGKDADFVVLNDDFDVIDTYCEGRQIFDHNIDTDLANQTYLDAYKIA